MGIVAFVVPSGIGVREAVIVAILTSSMDTDGAVAVAALSRAIAIVADFVFVALFATADIAGRSIGLIPASSSQVAQFTPESDHLDRRAA